MEIALDLLSGNPVLWAIAVVVLVIVSRMNKDAGLSNTFVDLLRQLLNAPPGRDPEKKEDRVVTLTELSSHLREVGEDSHADNLDSAVGAVQVDKKGVENNGQA